MSSDRRIELLSTDDGVAYVKVPNSGAKHKETLRIEDLVPDYKGPMVNFDLNADGELYGIEIVLFEEDFPIDQDSEQA